MGGGEERPGRWAVGAGTDNVNTLPMMRGHSNVVRSLGSIGQRHVCERTPVGTRLSQVDKYTVVFGICHTNISSKRCEGKNYTRVMTRPRTGPCEDGRTGAQARSTDDGKTGVRRDGRAFGWSSGWSDRQTA